MRFGFTWKRSASLALAGLARAWPTRSQPGRGRLRVLAYHAIPSAAQFSRQASYLAKNYSVIHPSEADRTDAGTPRVWITFDDGDPSVIEVGLPILSDLGLHATLFVCPGVLDSHKPYWWQIVESAAIHRLIVDGAMVEPSWIPRLKQIENAERLQIVEAVRRALEATLGEPFQVGQLTSIQLQRWVGAGNTVGNHTWDHPLMDRCEPTEQREQIGRAHDWLIEHFTPDQLLFAYPNGNWTSVSEYELARRGYDYALLFDHRVATIGNRLQVSRIRVNADDDLSTFISRVSGLHPLVHHALSRA